MKVQVKLSMPTAVCFDRRSNMVIGKVQLIDADRDREQRVVRIVEHFNSLPFDAEGRLTTKANQASYDAIRKDVLDMLRDRHPELKGVGKAIALALEVSRIVQCLGSNHARQYFHRFIQIV